MNQPDRPLNSHAPFRFVSGWPLLFLLCAACSGAAHAQSQNRRLSDDVRQLKPGQSITRDNVTFTMIQKDAGVADTSGWFAARGADGALSVLFPARFNEGVSSAKATDGALVTVHTLASSTANGIRLVLNCYERSDSKFPPDTAVNSVKGLENLSQRFRSQPFARGSINGTEFRGIYANGAEFAGQAFTTPRYLCEFLAEFPKTTWETIPTVVRKAFDSVRIHAAQKRSASQ
jgi:hypothetical protein